MYSIQISIDVYNIIYNWIIDYTNPIRVIWLSDFYVAKLRSRLAESVLDEMLQCQVSPDVFSYSALSSAWAKKGGKGQQETGYRSLRVILQGYLVNWMVFS